jgi:hypothetical protein
MQSRISARSLRSFGLIVGTGFAVVALWPTIFGDGHPRVWALIVTIVLGMTALACPSALGPFHRVWTAIGEALGWVNTRVILGLVYYLLVVPVGLVRRLLGNDPMRRQFDRDVATYKIPRGGRPASHMRRQY